MGTKNQQIIGLRNQQDRLKREIKRIKKKLPYHFFGLVFLSMGLYFLLSDYTVNTFGNDINFIMFLILLAALAMTVFLVLAYKAIKERNKKIRFINNQLYKLMKLETQ